MPSSAPRQTRFHAPALGTWTEEEADRYDFALALFGGLIADCSERIAASDDSDEVERLRNEQADYAAQRDALDPRNAAAVEEAIGQVQDRLEQLGA
jgi:hypothetical protein